MPKVCHDPKLIRKTYSIDLITPLFGGGCEPGKVDPNDRIRAPSIRGHLRFWWRATRGARFQSGGDLRGREAEIWGSVEKPSPVVVDVEITSPGREYMCATPPDDRGAPRFEVNHPPYALFPFQGSKKDDIQPARCIAGISFKLHIAYPQEFSTDVEAALWAWLNFGGIGARTRRGCGALYCKEFAPQTSKTVGEWYSENLKKYEINPPVRSSPKKWPTLPDKILIRPGEKTDAMQCWSEVIGLLQEFRQGVGVGRNYGQNKRPGRSRWPEPESIREITGKRHSRYQSMPNIPSNAFPRAEFGLPIIFHFPKPGDPGAPELYPIKDAGEKTRMSSPLILRPMRCQNGECLQGILWFVIESVREVVLTKGNNLPHRSTRIRDPQFASYTNSPLGPPKIGLKPRSAAGSALEAFYAYAKGEKNFTEVP